MNTVTYHMTLCTQFILRIVMMIPYAHKAILGSHCYYAQNSIKLIYPHSFKLIALNVFILPKLYRTYTGRYTDG